MFTEKELNTLDANLNRAKEGLRVIEDIVRFVLEEKELMLALKAQRHACTKIMHSSNISFAQLFNARKKRKDVGQFSFSSGERTRKDDRDLLLANFFRVQESLRVLEELFKKINTRTAFEFKQLRFKNYELQNEVMLEFERRMKLKQFNEAKLYAILTLEKESEKNYINFAKQLISAGIKIFQLRPKKLSDKQFLSVAKKLRKLTARKNALLIIDNRADIALLCNADGLHLGQNDLSVEECRNIIGFDKLIGKSTHSKSQLSSALKEKPDYVSVGPIFETKSVPYKTAGLQMISYAKKYAVKEGIPFVVIGGINEKNIKTVLRRGATHIAVISAITKAKNPKQAAEKLISLIK